MEKNIKDYLPFYLGCDVEYTNVLNKRVVAKVLPDFLYHNEISLAAALLHEPKPILRPLSDMTHEDVNELWEFIPMNPLYFPLNNDKRYDAIIQAFKTNEFPDYEDTWTWNNFNQAALWLRKHSFDIDGLIESGLAIDKTKI